MHDAGDEEDRERRKCEKPNEEQFERDEIHGSSLAGNDR